MPGFQSSSGWRFYPQRLEKRRIQNALPILIGQSFIFIFWISGNSNRSVTKRGPVVGELPLFSQSKSYNTNNGVEIWGISIVQSKCLCNPKRWFGYNRNRARGRARGVSIYNEIFNKVLFLIFSPLRWRGFRPKDCHRAWRSCTGFPESEKLNVTPSGFC